MRILLGRAPEFLGVVALATIVATCGSVTVKSEDGGAGGKDASTSGGAGATGTSGAVGSAGTIGSAGATGSAGTMGSAGATGSAGAMGNAGSGPRDGGSADATGTAGAGGHGGMGVGGASGSSGAGGIGGGGSGGSSGTCLRAKGCCANDNDCIAGDECVGGTCSATLTSAGVCKPKPTGNACWSNADCSVLTPTCNGPSVCKCGEECLVADKTGTCALILQ